MCSDVEFGTCSKYVLGHILQVGMAQTDTQSRVFCFTKFEPQDKARYVSIVTALGAQCVDVFGKSVTHVVCEDNKVCRNSKILSACAVGAWIVKKTYIDDSNAAGTWIRENEYELRDISNDAKKKGVSARWRLHLSKKPKGTCAFTGWNLVWKADHKYIHHKRLAIIGGANIVDEDKCKEATFVVEDNASPKPGGSKRINPLFFAMYLNAGPCGWGQGAEESPTDNEVASATKRRMFVQKSFSMNDSETSLGVAPKKNELTKFVNCQIPFCSLAQKNQGVVKGVTEFSDLQESYVRTLGQDEHLVQDTKRMMSSRRCPPSNLLAEIKDIALDVEGKNQDLASKANRLLTECAMLHVDNNGYGTPWDLESMDASDLKQEWELFVRCLQSPTSNSQWKWVEYVVNVLEKSSALYEGSCQLLEKVFFPLTMAHNRCKPIVQAMATAVTGKDYAKLAMLQRFIRLIIMSATKFKFRTKHRIIQDISYALRDLVIQSIQDRDALINSCASWELRVALLEAILTSDAYKTDAVLSPNLRDKVLTVEKLLEYYFFLIPPRQTENSNSHKGKKRSVDGDPLTTPDKKRTKKKGAHNNLLTPEPKSRALIQCTSPLQKYMGLRPKALAKRNQYGETKLHEKSKSGSLEIVQVLLDQGAEVNTKCNNNFTPLLDAVANEHVKVVELLLEANANPHFVGPDGTAIQEAQNIANQEVRENMLKVLSKHQAVPIVISSSPSDSGSSGVVFVAETRACYSTVPKVETDACEDYLRLLSLLFQSGLMLGIWEPLGKENMEKLQNHLINIATCPNLTSNCTLLLESMI
eukprot:m.117864 g.117864  ORF g.117864 m.117864 type:complete len:812 (-) comp14262_c0_seq3:102-2537(-)